MSLSRVALGCLLGALTCAPEAACAAPVLRAAEARIEFQSPTACTVELALSVDGAAEVEHRVEVVDGARVELIALHGATAAGAPRMVGRTRALVLRPDAATYTLRYAVEQPASRASRCPLWVPSVPADGRSQSVRLSVRLPAGALAAGTMPGLAWSANEGAVTLGHLPAFVRVPYAMPGQPKPLDIALVMDLVAIVTLVVASAAWARRGQGRGLAR
jgi:hypothetical protein